MRTRSSQKTGGRTRTRHLEQHWLKRRFVVAFRRSWRDEGQKMSQHHAHPIVPVLTQVCSTPGYSLSTTRPDQRRSSATQSLPPLGCVSILCYLNRHQKLYKLEKLWQETPSLTPSLTLACSWESFDVTQKKRVRTTQGIQHGPNGRTPQ